MGRWFYLTNELQLIAEPPYLHKRAERYESLWERYQSVTISLWERYQIVMGVLPKRFGSSPNRRPSDTYEIVVEEGHRLLRTPQEVVNQQGPSSGSIFNSGRYMLLSISRLTIRDLLLDGGRGKGVDERHIHCERVRGRTRKEYTERLYVTIKRTPLRSAV